MKKTAVNLFAALAVGLLCGAVSAHQGTAAGVLRKIDADASRVIVKHGEFKGIQMSAMTMAFKVRDKSLLDGFKEQDAVRITVEHEGKDFVITRMERVSGDPVIKNDK
jgi:Cu(I)/Ag(I) efflux system periplasmic protein CusF